MTRTTGWLGNDEQAPEPRGAAGFTEFILSNRADPGQGRTLEQVLARAAAAPDRGGPEPADLDDRMAGLLTRGYSPGLISQLSMRLGDVSAALQAEREKLEKGIRRAEQVRQMHEAGRVSAWDMMNMLGDEGDEGRVRQLERQQASLQQQLEAASEAIAPAAQRTPDPVEAAVARARDAHREYVEVTRQRMADMQAGRPASRPFAGRGHAARSDQPVTCKDCIAVGANWEQSVMIHQDPDAPIEAQFVDLSEKTLAAFGREDQAQAERHAYSGAEISR